MLCKAALRCNALINHFHITYRIMIKNNDHNLNLLHKFSLLLFKSVESFLQENKRINFYRSCENFQNRHRSLYFWFPNDKNMQQVYIFDDTLSVMLSCFKLPPAFPLAFFFLTWKIWNSAKSVYFLNFIGLWSVEHRCEVMRRRMKGRGSVGGGDGWVEGERTDRRCRGVTGE